MNAGDIEVKSSIGQGTTFIVRFPKLMKEEVSADQVQSADTDSSLNKKINKHTEYVG